LRLTLDSVTRSWRGTVIVCLVGVALLLLQVSFLGKTLVYNLPSYALVAAASVISFATFKMRPAADRLCLLSTALFAGYLILRTLTSPIAYFARLDLYCVLAALLLYAIALTGLGSPGRRLALIFLLLAFAMYHVLLGLVQFGIGENFISLPFFAEFKVTKRASGFYINPDHLAGLLEALGILALSIACWARRPKTTRVIAGYLALGCYIGLALTQSRGGYLSAAVSLLVFGILSGKSLYVGSAPAFRSYRWAALIVAIVGLIAVGFAIRESIVVRDRVLNIVSPDRTRFDLWRAAIRQWQLQPILGTGSETYRFYGREFRAPRVQVDPVMVHNDYLHLLCEYGVIGAALFCFFLATHLRAGWKTFSRYGPQRVAAGSAPLSDRLALTIGALCVVAAYGVHSAVDFNLHLPANALLVAFAFGMLAYPGETNTNGKTPHRADNTLRFSGIVIGLLVFWLCVRLLPGEYFSERSRIALENEDPETALAFARKALTYDQQNPTIFFQLGRGLEALAEKNQEPVKRRENFEAALDAFDRARALAPLDGTHALDEAFVYDRMERFSEAEWMYGLAVARDPKSETMLHLYQHHLDLWRSGGNKKADTTEAR
jgi:O-antigen ligase